MKYRTSFILDPLHKESIRSAKVLVSAEFSEHTAVLPLKVLYQQKPSKGKQTYYYIEVKKLQVCVCVCSVRLSLVCQSNVKPRDLNLKHQVITNFGGSMRTYRREVELLDLKLLMT